MIGNTKTMVMADSGATVNILNQEDYLPLHHRPQLAPSKSHLFPYMSDKPLVIQGKFEAEIRSDQCTSKETFYIVSGPSGSLLSWKTTQKLRLIKVANAISEQPNAPEFLCDFPDITSGMDAYKGEPVNVHVDPSFVPVAQPHRRIPFYVRQHVEGKLKELEESDIIERSEGPTPWISPIMVVSKPKKPDEIRIFVDMRSVNRAIIRERHIIPTIDDIAADLNG
ncbi:PREDICTED: uncharacterized protein LOC106819462 [Priapulus caudatus]|uniref:Uncharacterized protein LOC106819462 n=1 Tax=Priapulus caudatus TaxID=37621 RepID=A0ABM1F557_PRICU|nr:PREDICTED: uncharacterized protein LOC106819462 [Priapulus caudatus]